MNKKVISLCLAAVMTASAVPTSVLAASIGSSSTDANIGEDTAQNAKTSYAEIFKNNNETQVYLTVDDKDRVVSLPTTVILSGTPDAQGKYIGKYSVGVSGDMSGKKIVKVEPESTASLTQKGKNNVTASIAQDQVSFDTDDFKNKTVTNGSISTDSLTAGSWNSNFNFNVSTEVNSVPAGYTLLYKYDLSATKQDNVAAYYCVPNKNAEKIEVRDNSSENSSKTITSMISALNPFAPMTAYAAENTVIESNGVKYTLSDKDTLVISGKGTMKENIQSDFYNYEALYKAVSEHFNMPYHISTTWSYDTIEQYYIVFPQNGKHASEFYNYKKGYGYSGDIEYNGITIDDVNSYIDTIIDNYATMPTPSTVIIEDGISNVSKNAFTNCDTLETVVLSDNIRYIDDAAFSGCVNLKNINFPVKLYTIGKNAFSKCTSLKEVNLSKCSILKSIGDYAFQSSGIINFTSSNSVTDISNCFNGCHELENVILSKKLSRINHLLFGGCSKLKNLYVNCDNAILWGFYDVFYEDGKYAPENIYFTSKEQFTHQSSIIGAIPRNATHRTNIYINGELLVNAVDVGGSFTNSTVETVRIPRTQKYIGSNCFRNCTNLREVYLHSDVFGRDSTCPAFEGRTFSDLKDGSVIYCETQEVANKISSSDYDSSKTTIVVDASKF